VEVRRPARARARARSLSRRGAASTTRAARAAGIKFRTL